METWKKYKLIVGALKYILVNKGSIKEKIDRFDQIKIQKLDTALKDRWW